MIELSVHGAAAGSPDARVLVNPVHVVRVRSMGRGEYAGVYFADGSSFRVQEPYDIVAARLGYDAGVPRSPEAVSLEGLGDPQARHRSAVHHLIEAGVDAIGWEPSRCSEPEEPVRYPVVGRQAGGQWVRIGYLEAGPALSPCSSRAPTAPRPARRPSRSWPSRSAPRSSGGALAPSRPQRPGRRERRPRALPHLAPAPAAVRLDALRRAPLARRPTPAPGRPARRPR